MFIIKIGRALGVSLILATQRPGQGLAADRRLRQRVHPVLPEGRRPDRERHDPRHVGVQERRAGDDVPAEDRRRARLPEGRGEHAPGRADLLPEQRRHRAGGQARPGHPRGGRDAVRRRARRGRHRAAARRPGRRARGVRRRSRRSTGPSSPSASPSGSPSGGKAPAATRCRPSCAAAACRPWSSPWTGERGRGCRLEAVQAAAGQP